LLAKGIRDTHGEIRVLHVDDDPNQFEFIKFFLNQADPILNVNCVGTPTDVFRELETGNYDCLVTDFQMPLMDGITLASKVREKHSTPIILYTGQGSEEVAESAFTIGVDDYIRKEMDPSHYQVLAKRIRHVVEKKRAETLYQSAIEGIRDGMCIVVGQTIVYANQIQADIFGAKSPADILDTEALSYVHPDDLERAQAKMIQASTGVIDPPFMKYKILRKNGETVDVEALTSIIKYNGTDAFLVLTRDLTERNKLEQERMKVEERFRTIIELAPDGIVTVSLKGIVTSVNAAFSKITGYQRDEILGKRFYQIGSLRNIDLRNNLKVFATIARGKLPPPVEFVFQFKDGTQGWGEAHLAFIDNNNSKELLAIVRDITERKWVEKEVNQYSDELKKIVIDRKNIENGQERISWSNHLSSSIGVDFQDSLFTINNSISELRKDPSKLNELLDKMELSVDSASIQLKELFDNDPHVQTKDVDIFNLVEESVNEADIPPEIDTVTSFNGANHFKVNPDKMKLAVNNLVRNAVNMMPEGGSLSVSCDSFDDSLIIEVGSNGNLLLDSEVERLLVEGSLQTDCTMLSISEGQKIAEEHGGSILVNSVRDKGTTYMMILPKDYRSNLQSQDVKYVDYKVQ
jgi:PAS domain S-box-containing protein